MARLYTVFQKFQPDYCEDFGQAELIKRPGVVRIVERRAGFLELISVAEVL
jgi:hypothetical protein